MKNFTGLKINVAYSEILAYDERGDILYTNSNVSKYNIHPWYTVDATRVEDLAKPLGITLPYHITHKTSQRIREFLGGLDSNRFERILDNTFKNFVPRELDEIYKTNENFIYPIIIHNNDLFIKYPTLDLDERVVECVLNNRAKVVFIQSTEGFFAENEEEVIWLSKVSKKYGFNKENFIIITSNLKAKDNYEEILSKGKINDNLTVRPYSYFQHNLWFAGNGNLNHNEQIILTRKFNKFIQSNQKDGKAHHFLSFNRIVKPHRVAIFGELMANDKLKGKSIVSMGGTPHDPQGHYHSIMSNVNVDYRYDKNKLLEFFKNYDSTKHYIYDQPRLEDNHASSFCEEAHQKCFVNIVTESLIGNNSIFFSEKTYKPILAGQPFIIFGSPNSLKKLKELGFKTFDKWWDESYDNEENFTRRLEKIVGVLEVISQWDLDKCKEVINEMESVLRHNFDAMINSDDTYDLFSLLNSKQKMERRIHNRKILGVCGDSYMTAKGKGTHFTEMLSEELNWDYKSFAFGGCSNSAIRLQIDEIIKLNVDYAFIGATSPDRMELPINDMIRPSPYNKKLGFSNLTSYNTGSDFLNRNKSLFSSTIHNFLAFRDGHFSNKEQKILKQWIGRFYDYYWKIQQDTWIIADGLRKLKDHGIKFSCVNHSELYEDDLSFIKDNLAPQNEGLNPVEYLTEETLNLDFHTTPESQKQLFNNWLVRLSHLNEPIDEPINDPPVEFKRRLI